MFVPLVLMLSGCYALPTGPVRMGQEKGIEIMAKNRRPQNSKPAKSGNTKYVEAMQGKRFSSAAGYHKKATDYRRKPKHVGRGWE